VPSLGIGEAVEDEAQLFDADVGTEGSGAGLESDSVRERAGDDGSKPNASTRSATIATSAGSSPAIAMTFRPGALDGRASSSRS
jgi:hypothetical protein